MPAAYTAGDVMQLAAALLNDVSRTLFTYAVQLPYLKSAQEDLESNLVAEGINFNLKVTTDIALTAGTTFLTLPTDFFVPITLWERPATSTDETAFRELSFTPYLKFRPQETDLLEWTYQGGVINFIGATQDKDVRLLYWKTFVDIVDETSSETVFRAKNMLAYRCAALCAEFILRDLDRASSLNNQSQYYGDLLISILVKSQQKNRVRRRPFRVNYRRRMIS